MPQRLTPGDSLLYLSQVQNLLFHIDSRCIHGQVVAGWGFQEHVQRFLLANDEVAADECERDQYLNTPGSDFETHVLGIAEAVKQLTAWNDGKRTMLIVSSPHDALRVLESGITHDLVTIGNLEPGPGRQQLSATVFVTPADRDDLTRILARGVQVLVKPLPATKPQVVAELLKAK
jgi:mannose/fructose/N-acetylgalactosamine-specific phosphotransferase system component IIB